MALLPNVPSMFHGPLKSSRYVSSGDGAPASVITGTIDAVHVRNAADNSPRRGLEARLRTPTATQDLGRRTYLTSRNVRRFAAYSRTVSGGLSSLKRTYSSGSSRSKAGVNRLASTDSSAMPRGLPWARL